MFACRRAAGAASPSRSTASWPGPSARLPDASATFRRETFTPRRFRRRLPLDGLGRGRNPFGVRARLRLLVGGGDGGHGGIGDLRCRHVVSVGGLLGYICYDRLLIVVVLLGLVWPGLGGQFGAAVAAHVPS